MDVQSASSAATWVDAAKICLECLLAATMPVTVAFVIHWRLKAGRAASRGVVRFLAVGLVVPLIAILGLEKVLDSSALSALIGAMIGSAVGPPSQGSKSGASDNEGSPTDKD